MHTFFMPYFKVNVQKNFPKVIVLIITVDSRRYQIIFIYSLIEIYYLDLFYKIRIST
jgi:hypothetical protein